MKGRPFRFVRQAVWIGLGATALMACGCKPAANSTSSGPAGNLGPTSRFDPGKFSPTSASLCLQQMIKNPPGPLHLSFAERSSDEHATSVEANVTPTTIDYTRSETVNGQTSTTTKNLANAQMSEMELDYAVMSPVPWHGELVAAQDAAKNTGDENVNGFSAVKYSIDTANEPASQKAAFDSLMAVRDYTIAGTAWVTSDTGCLVKYAIDFEQDAKNGSVKKTHFEGNVTQK